MSKAKKNIKSLPLRIDPECKTFGRLKQLNETYFNNRAESIIKFFRFSEILTGPMLVSLAMDKLNNKPIDAKKSSGELRSYVSTVLKNTLISNWRKFETVKRRERKINQR